MSLWLLGALHPVELLTEAEVQLKLEMMHLFYTAILPGCSSCWYTEAPGFSLSRRMLGVWKWSSGRQEELLALLPMLGGCSTQSTMLQLHSLT